MFVFDENEWDISFITVYYCSIRVISFIFYMARIFWWNITRLNGIEIFKRFCPIQKNRPGIGKKYITLMLDTNNFKSAASILKIFFLLWSQNYLNEEVNCTEPSPSVRVTRQHHTDIKVPRPNVLTTIHLMTLDQIVSFPNSLDKCKLMRPFFEHLKECDQSVTKFMTMIAINLVTL